MYFHSDLQPNKIQSVILFQTKFTEQRIYNIAQFRDASQYTSIYFTTITESIYP